MGWLFWILVSFNFYSFGKQNPLKFLIFRFVFRLDPHCNHQILLSSRTTNKDIFKGSQVHIESEFQIVISALGTHSRHLLIPIRPLFSCSYASRYGVSLLSSEIDKKQSGFRYNAAPLYVIPFIPFPLVVGLSRVALGRHYITDVLAGKPIFFAKLKLNRKDQKAIIL